MSLLAPVRRSATASTVLYAVRHASSSGNAASSSSKPAAASSVQRADEQLALRHKQQAAMRRSGRQMDIMSANIQILESIVEPPFQPSWIFQKGFFTYIKERAKRYWGGTRASLLNMRNRGAAPAQLAKSTFESAWMLFSNRKPSNRFRPLLNDLSRVYVDYNVAQASADAMRIRAIAIGEASSHAQAVIKSDRKMTWELVKEIEKPRILWARIAQVHEETEVGQVAVRFDTEQALTTINAGQRTTKRQRVVENYVFERYMPVREGWKIKAKLNETPPPIGERFGQ